jgi:hypothetical protein
MTRLGRALHRLVGHRFKGCTLRDMTGDVWRGRLCHCGHVDDAAWTLVGTAVNPIRPGEYETWTAHAEREAQHTSRRLDGLRRVT